MSEHPNDPEQPPRSNLIEGVSYGELQNRLRSAEMIMNKRSLRKCLIGLSLAGSLMPICFYLGSQSENNYTKTEFSYNMFFFTHFLIMIGSYTSILLLKYEPYGRRGCFNKTRHFFFILLRTLLLSIYFFTLIYRFLFQFFPRTWTLSNSLQWTESDETTRPSYSRMNHVVCFSIWFSIHVVIYSYLLAAFIYALSFTILLFRGDWGGMAEICQNFGLYFLGLFAWVSATIKNESYMRSMA